MAFHTNSWNPFTLSFEDLKGRQLPAEVGVHLLCGFRYAILNMQTCLLRFARNTLLAFPLILVLRPRSENTVALIVQNTSDEG